MAVVAPQRRGSLVVVGNVAAALVFLLAGLGLAVGGGVAVGPRSAASTSKRVCPEDSVPVVEDAVDQGDEDEDGELECRCVFPCPDEDEQKRRSCLPGQQSFKIRDADPETPGRCCALYECRDQDVVRYLSPEEALAGGHCVDEETGQLHENGTTWQGLADPCVECACESGSRSCHAAMCRSCPRPQAPLPGECCPRCCPLPVESEDEGDCSTRVCESDPETGCETCECVGPRSGDDASANDGEPKQDWDDQANEEEEDKDDKWRPGLPTILVLVSLLALLGLLALALAGVVLSRFRDRLRLRPNSADKYGHKHHQHYKCVPPYYEPAVVVTLSHAQKAASAL